MILLLAIVQLSIAAIMFHKVMPVARARTTTCGLRVWFFSSAMACYGGAAIIKWYGYSDDILSNSAHIFIVVAGALWVARAKGSWVGCQDEQ